MEVEGQAAQSAAAARVLYKAAGVLPFSRNSFSGDAMILLGGEARGMYVALLTFFFPLLYDTVSLFPPPNDKLLRGPLRSPLRSSCETTPVACACQGRLTVPV